MAGSGQGTQASDTGPALSITDLRDYLWDLTADNTLLDEQEFSNAFLQKARDMVVEDWNASPPITTSYSASSFPSKYVFYWRLGAAAQALRMASFRYLRNRLAYQAGGVTIDDIEAKAQLYDQMADKLWAQWVAYRNLEKRRVSDLTCFLKLD